MICSTILVYILCMYIYMCVCMHVHTHTWWNTVYWLGNTPAFTCLSHQGCFVKAATRMVCMFLMQSRNLTTAPRASPPGCVSSCIHANQQTGNWVSAVTDWGFHLESGIWQGSQIQSFRHTGQLFLFSPSKSFSITRHFDNVILEIFSYHVPKQGELFFKISFFLVAFYLFPLSTTLCLLYYSVIIFTFIRYPEFLASCLNAR